MSIRPTVRHRLENGLRVVLAPDHRTPIVGISLWYGVGSRHERTGRGGFAHLFEHMMFEGSANVARGEHFSLIQGVGGRTNAYTGLDATVYGDTVPSHALELALWLEADRMATLGHALSEQTLAAQRDVVKNERRKRVDNQPYGTWEERIFALAFPASHPYHHSSWGSLEDLSAATLDDVQSFFASHYVPNNATLTIVGDLEVETTLDTVARLFGPIPRGELPNAGGVDAEIPMAAGRDEVHEAGAPLARLYVGCPIPPLSDDGFAVTDLLTDLLTTGRASRLQARLVRELRLAHSVEAWTFPLVDGASLLLLEATAQQGVAPAALESALSAELDRLGGEPSSEDELMRVRLRRKTNRAAAMQQAEERADRIGMYAALLDDPDRIATEDARDALVDADAVCAAARRWLGPDNRAQLWYLPTVA